MGLNFKYVKGKILYRYVKEFSDMTREPRQLSNFTINCETITYFFHLKIRVYL